VAAASEVVVIDGRAFTVRLTWFEVTPSATASNVSSPGVVPVRTTLVMPPKTVGLPRPETAPLPETLEKTTTLEWSAVSRLAYESSSWAVSVHDFVEVKAAGQPVSTTWLRTPGPLGVKELLATDVSMGDVDDAVMV
jgi:hypothetical protein